jgi:hypothetical protein
MHAHFSSRSNKKKRAQNAAKLVSFFLQAKANAEKPSLKNCSQDAYKIGDFFFLYRERQKSFLKKHSFFCSVIFARKEIFAMSSSTSSH